MHMNIDLGWGRERHREKKEAFMNNSYASLLEVPRAWESSIS